MNEKEGTAIFKFDEKGTSFTSKNVQHADLLVAFASATASVLEDDGFSDEQIKAWFQGMAELVGTEEWKNGVERGNTDD